MPCWLSPLGELLLTQASLCSNRCQHPRRQALPLCLPTLLYKDLPNRCTAHHLSPDMFPSWALPLPPTIGWPDDAFQTYSGEVRYLPFPVSADRQTGGLLSLELAFTAWITLAMPRSIGALRHCTNTSTTGLGVSELDFQVRPVHRHHVLTPWART